MNIDWGEEERWASTLRDKYPDTRQPMSPEDHARFERYLTSPKEQKRIQDAIEEGQRTLAEIERTPRSSYVNNTRYCA